MSGQRPMPDHPLSDEVLAELHAAFAAGDPADPSAVDYDFDDPSIDRLLGIDTGDAAVPDEADADGRADVDVDVDVHDTSATEAMPAVTVSPVVVTAPATAGHGAPGVEPDPGAHPARRVVVIDDADQTGDVAYLDVGEAAAVEGEAAAVEGEAASVGGEAASVEGSVSPGTLAAGGRDPGMAGARTTIVIDNLDDHSEVVVGDRAASSSIDPRLKARRVAVNRAAGRRRLLWAGVAAAVVLVAVTVVAVLASTIFDVRNVTVQSEYTDKALIAHVVEELRGTPILRVDTRKYERELEASPWVESARVSTNFPHDVLIDIRERHPQAAFVGSDGQWRVIDRDGRVLAVLASRPLAYMPITGTAPDSDAGQFAGPTFAAAAQLVIGLPPEIRSITSSVGVDAATGQLTLALDSADATGVNVRLGTVAGIEDKLARLLTFVRQGLKPGQQLDVSTADVAT